MKILLSLTAVLLSLGVAAPLRAQNSGAPTTPKEKLSYAFGMNLATTMKAKGVDLDPQMFANAMHDVFSGGETQMTNAQAIEILTAADQELRSKPNPNTTFLAANKGKPGVVALPDGLQYKVIKEGAGASPKDTDTVVVKYRGSTIDGREFDNSDKHGGTLSLPVNGVIKGWTEALKKMKVGAKWQLFIPANLAYGDQGSANIPPGATLIFDVELVSIGK